jgi:phytanoyl-CoA hydroxylase
MATATVLTAEQRREAEERGYLIVRDAFEPDQFERYRDLIQEYIDERRSLPDGMHRPSPERLYAIDVDPVLREIAFNRTVVGVNQELLGAERLKLFSLAALFKVRGEDSVKRMHQDFHGFRTWFDEPVAKNLWNSWVALDDMTPENGCLMFIPRSHERGIVPDEVTRSAGYYSESELVTEPMPAGSVAFFNALTMHHSERNVSDRPRRAVSVNLVPADARYVGSKPEPEFIDVP